MRNAMLAAGVAAAIVFSAVSETRAGSADTSDLLAQAEQPKGAQPEQPKTAPQEQPKPANQAPPRNGDQKPQGAPHAREPSAPPPQARPRPRVVAPKRDAKIDSHECSWVGKRTIRVLMRDDLIAAEGFLKFYNAFGCPVKYLGQAFGCALGVVEGAPAKAIENRIEVCWQDASAKPETAQPPAAPQPQPPAGQKPATPPKPAPRAVAPPAKPEPETAYPKR